MARKRKKKNTGIRVIKKANKLVESRYRFDIWETRIFLSTLSQIKRVDEDFKVYRIWYKDVIKTFGLKSAQSYEFLRDAARGLMRKVFYVTSIVEGQKRETEYHIIRTVNYLAEGEKGGDNQDYIDITIDPEMKPLLLQLGNYYKDGNELKGENYTAYDLINIVKLGAYHVRIYELLKQYQTIGNRQMEVEEIKRMLEITTEYPLFGNFFQKVIQPSVKAINKHTDLNITKLEKVKRGRKVHALYFEFREKTDDEKKKARGVTQQRQLALDLGTREEEGRAEETKFDKLFNKYHTQLKESFGVTPSKFLQALKADETIDDERIQKAMRVTRRARTNGEIKKSEAGFFMVSLKDEYTDPKEEAKRKEFEKKQKAQGLKLQLQALELEKNDRINDRIKEVVTDSPTITEKAIEKIGSNPFTSRMVAKKSEALGRSLTVEDYRQDIQLRELVKANIVELSKDRFADILKDYETKKKQVKAEG
ncbi:replication initiation protein [Saprospiraceae bacterium]|nr:replication initiation protein [Saprospiraceae bacterium]